MDKMSYFTHGREFHKDITMKIACNESNNLTDTPELKDFFKIILISNGAGIININSKNVLYTAPVLFCLTEKDIFSSFSSNNSETIKTIFFHPFVVNSRFKYENIRMEKHDFTGTDKQDLSLLRAFLKRNDKYEGVLNLGPTSLLRFIEHYAFLKNELELQVDNFWPCRSRSYFLEILFFIEKRFNQNDSQNIKIGNINNMINNVLCFLHENYYKKITLNELAKEFSTNRTTLEKTFYENVGSSIISYLINLRINMAIILLKDTKIPVNEIIFRVGYNDVANFGRTFKKITTFSPTEYREKFNVYKYK